MNSLENNNSPECEQCGRCLMVCPSYNFTKTETFSPRGRLNLIKAAEEKEFTPSSRFNESIDSCLQCLACHHTCPKGVDGAGLIQETKTQLLLKEKTTFNRVERLVLKLFLANSRVFSSFARFASIAQNLIPGNKEGSSRHLPLFLPDLIKGRRIPKLSGASLYKKYPKVIEPSTEKLGNVILFAGCYFSFVDTAPAEAAIKVLTANGYSVTLADKHSCCGAPSYLGGYPELGKKTAAKNLDNLAGADQIVTLCATCGNCLKNDYIKLFPTGEANHKAISVAQRVIDINLFLNGLESFTIGPKAISQKVTFHDPCHMNHGLNVAKETRKITKEIAGLDYQEMEDSANCCGGGGLCSVHNAELSSLLGENKAKRIEESGAEIVLAPCPGCLIQIRDRLSRHSSGVEALHPIEIIAKTYDD